MNYANLILILLMLTAAISLDAKVFRVGTGQTYLNPQSLYEANVLATGDTVEIDAEVYNGKAALAEWKADSLLIRGVNGTPHMKADGQYILGKGIWVCSGHGITVENIEFSGASVPDKNGAGIRLDGDGLTVRHCFFHDNENGILTSNSGLGDIVIEYSEFANNGFGDGLSHNLYVGKVNSLTFQFNYSHHAKIGHCLKSRAKKNYIAYNRIMDEESGNSSRLIDLSNGGFSIVMGNVLMQGPEAENNNLVGYGLEGLLQINEPHEFYFIHNTCVNKRVASCIFVSVKEGIDVANISNNIFAGSGRALEGPYTVQVGNYTTNSVTRPDFVDEANYDYHINASSPAIDKGWELDPVNDISLTPESSYAHKMQMEQRDRVGEAFDAGAYEFLQTTSSFDKQTPSFEFYPNPTSDFIHFRSDVSGRICRIFTVSGTLMLSKVMRGTTVQISSLNPGMYIMTLGGDSRSVPILIKE